MSLVAADWSDLPHQELDSKKIASQSEVGHVQSRRGIGFQSSEQLHLFNPVDLVTRCQVKPRGTQPFPLPRAWHPPSRERSSCNGFERVNKLARTLCLLIYGVMIMRYSLEKVWDTASHIDRCIGWHNPRITEPACPEFIPHHSDIIFPCIE